MVYYCYTHITILSINFASLLRCVAPVCLEIRGPHHATSPHYHVQESAVRGCLDDPLAKCLVVDWNALKNMRTRQLGWLFPIYGKNVPNHQPVIFLFRKQVAPVVAPSGMAKDVHFQRLRSPEPRHLGWLKIGANHVTNTELPQCQRISKFHLVNTLWFHQTWLAGKSPINGGFNRKSLIIGPVSIEMFDYRRVSAFWGATIPFCWIS